MGLIRDGVEWREAGRNTRVESEACARIFEPCCSYMSVRVSFSPALVKMAKLSAPGLRYGSRGSQACVAWPTCVWILEVGEEKLPPEKIGTAAPYFLRVSFEVSHLPFGNTNIASYFRRIGDFVTCWLSNGTFSILSWK